MSTGRTPEQALATSGAIVKRYGPGADVPTVEPLRTVDAAALAGLPVPRRAFLDTGGLFPCRNVTMLSGDGGTGKSLLALQLSIAVATGSDWIGFGVGQGKVLYLSAEDDRDEMHIRLAEICNADGIDLSRLRGLELGLLAGEDAVLGAEQSMNLLKTTARFASLRQRLRHLRPRLLVLDNLADVFAGNENSKPLARQFIGTLRRLAIDYDCVVLLLSHPSLSGISSGSGTSGNTAWNNSVRSRLYLTREKDDSQAEPDPELRVLQTMKANYGPVGSRLLLRWSEGWFVRSDVATPGQGEAPARQGRAEMTFLRLLEWHNEKGLNVSPNKSSTFAPAMFERHGDSAGIRKREFERAMHSLLDQGGIEVVQQGRPSRPSARLMVCGSK